VSAIFDILPTEFRVSTDPLAMITLWRGDKIGREVIGMLCSLGDVATAEQQVTDAALGGRDALNQLIDRHTDKDPDSPLISVTSAIARAQGYARRPGETVFELALPAYRLFGDPYNIGSPRRGNATELFVAGRILPSDITAIKRNNHDTSASELFHRDANGTPWILSASWLSPQFRHDPNRKPNPLGIWDRTQSWQQAA